MATSQKYFDPRTLAKLRGLTLRARHIVEGYVAGFHRSPMRGFSIEFAEHREYAPGDDLRHVDWKVFGRTDKFYVKQYEDETNLLCYLVVDVSESMTYRSDPELLTKLEYAQTLAASLAWLITQQSDAVGLVTFDREIRNILRPSSSPSHLGQLLQVLEQNDPQEKTDTGRVFHELARRLTRRGVVAIFSDLFDDVEPLLSGLKHLRYRQHDVVLFHLFDPAELDFPFQQNTLFKGLEQFPEITTDPRAMRKAYLEEVHGYLEQIERQCRAFQIDHAIVRTTDSLDQVITTMIAKRSNVVN